MSFYIVSIENLEVENYCNVFFCVFLKFLQFCKFFYRYYKCFVYFGGKLCVFLSVDNQEKFFYIIGIFQVLLNEFLIYDFLQNFYGYW